MKNKNILYGSYNIFVGKNAGYRCTSGSYNICIGDNAGNWITNESQILSIYGYDCHINKIKWAILYYVIMKCLNPYNTPVSIRKLIIETFR